MERFLKSAAWAMWVIAGLLLALACLMVSGVLNMSAYGQTIISVPQAALKHRAELTRTAHAQWGLNAPVATFAAQLQQESGFNAMAVSRVGAAGMAQFMPATARWWCQINGMTLGDCQPNNPTWALRSLVGYNKWLYDRIAASNTCNRLAFMLSAYNGGLGWVQRDKVLARTNLLNPAIWFDQVERVNAGRSQSNWLENRDYPRRILLRYEPVYAAAGWPSGRSEPGNAGVCK